MTNMLLAELVRPFALIDPAPARGGLTARERDVLELLAEGRSTSEVAAQLSYSERTIKNVVRDVTTRLEVRNRTQAVAYAVRNGWI